MSFSRLIQWYHSHADPIWPDTIVEHYRHPGQADGEVDVGEVPGHRDGEVWLLCRRRWGRRVRVDLATLSDHDNVR
jgi:hypothetical protein